MICEKCWLRYSSYCCGCPNKVYGLGVDIVSVEKEMKEISYERKVANRMKNVVTMFDKNCSEEKKAEGLGVSFAFATGACARCPYLSRCEMDRSFVFPDDAACSVEKRRVLKHWEGANGT